MVNNLLIALYALIGAMMALAAIESFRDRSNPARFGTGTFWTFLAIIFAFGDFIPATVVGTMLVIIGVLALARQIKVGHLPAVNVQNATAAAHRLGGWIFLPSIVLAVVSIIIAQFTSLGGQVGIGIGALVSLIVAIVMTRTSGKQVYSDTQRMVRSVGAPGVLPQLLATLGAVFTAAGVGTLTAKLIAGVFPAGNQFGGVVLYCVAMAVFTAIMGNAFAAFAVITAAIGVPFVIAQGGNVAVVAAIGMTSGYCGTLMTPMAANFNSLPVALMEMDDEMGVIRQQAPVAIILLVLQIGLMYFLAF
ncbi:DUF979 domain-containing protein [Lacticaseibacillus pantheris]|jgi:uncharacterized membrane protein|uniref:Membrane protein n=1 Tax=Lacticaseibacillus pantheris DSM 15945 = JCM 12539 = NBRC 106106 TaxID=1423783 RepID=A0A0R1U0R4_9LACO|nr:DUF979 domain-containing protein [Lacticaseibacillus pantheris]KRL86993.1 membrane protein [Lacticaseibacillus pantheris DSM 15945 = JCM 12539 = NBRC 106106]WKF85436.1 DUF979 domain-containing protein [Lacticaseibacillus pantheris]